MPIKVPDNLPALETLSSEGVDLITEQTAARQDIRPLRLLLLNLMPKEKGHRSSVRPPVRQQPVAGGYAADDHSQLYPAQY